MTPHRAPNAAPGHRPHVRRRGTRRVVAACTAVLTAGVLGLTGAGIGAPRAGATTTPGNAGTPVTLTGRVLVAHGDPRTPSTAPTPERTWLQGSGRPVPVVGLDPRLAGELATVTGRYRAGTLTATAARPESQTAARPGLTRTGFGATSTAATAATGTRTVRTAYLLARFASDPLEPYPLAQARARVFGATNSVAAYYRDATDGAVSLTGDVLGWYTVDTTDTCDWQAWSAQAQAAASSAGIDMSQYQEVVVAGPPRQYCPFAGVAYVGVSGAYINGYPSVYVVAHEVGHNFGSHHASTLRCTSAGSPVTLSASCTRYEYGDPYSVMGSSTRLHHAQQTYQITEHMTGALPPGAIVTTSSGTVTLARRHAGRLPQLVRVPRGTSGTSFDLELRATTGSFDAFPAGANPVSGVLIRLSPSNLGDVSQSQLLDATPATDSFEDAAFTAGSSLVDPVSGTRITVTAVTAQGATITVGPAGDTAAPSAPGALVATPTLSSVALRWTAAVDAGGIGAYQVAVDDQLVGTTTATSFTVTGIAPNSSHRYRVWARDRAGNLGPEANVTVRTLADTVPPSRPGALRVSATATTLTVTWARSTDNAMLYGYAVDVNGAGQWVNPTDSPTLTLTGLTPATAYTVTVTAIDISGNRSPAVRTTASTRPDTTAPQLGALRLTGPPGAWTVSWDPATDDVGATGYQVSCDGRNPAVQPTTSWTGTCGAGTHQLTVAALDAAGNLSRPVRITLR